jgi:mono/diheme cytochrome c family protein
MREIIARLICVLTVVVVLALAHGFAARHNPQGARPIGKPEEVATAAGVTVSAPDIVRGREVYAGQGCASCHAIAGSGNPRNPLDGVGARRSRAELLEWITGTGAAADQLSPAVVRRKERYRELSPRDSNALIAYLAGLTTPP